MATVKTCFKCSTEKPLTEFYPHPMMADGHLNKCRECTKRDVREHRAANDSVREYDRQRGKLPHRRENVKRQQLKWMAAFPERKYAHGVVAKALKSGKLDRLPCWVCGGERSEAHHPDYSHPLDVVWLCPRHHKLAHALVMS